MASIAVDAMREEMTYGQRLEAIRAAKLEQTREKQEVIGAMDYDDWALVLPPEESREMVETISGSGVAINDVMLKGVEIRSDHENGGFFDADTCGANFRSLLEAHPPDVDPNSSLAGAYMANFFSYSNPN